MQSLPSRMGWQGLPYTPAITAAFPVPFPGFPFLPSQSIARDISLTFFCHTGSNTSSVWALNYLGFHHSSLNLKSLHPLNYENQNFISGFYLYWTPRRDEIFAKHSPFFLNSQFFKNTLEVFK